MTTAVYRTLLSHYSSGCKLP